MFHNHRLHKNQQCLHVAYWGGGSSGECVLNWRMFQIGRFLELDYRNRLQEIQNVRWDVWISEDIKFRFCSPCSIVRTVKGARILWVQVKRVRMLSSLYLRYADVLWYWHYAQKKVHVKFSQVLYRLFGLSNLAVSMRQNIFSHSIFSLRLITIAYIVNNSN